MKLVYFGDFLGSKYHGYGSQTDLKSGTECLGQFNNNLKHGLFVIKSGPGQRSLTRFDKGL